MGAFSQLLSLVKRSPQIQVEEPKLGKEIERVSPEAVMAMALLKAYIEQEPVDVEGISGLFVFNSAVKCLTANSHIALRRVPSGGVPGKGVYSEDVSEFVGRLVYLAGYASYGDNRTIHLTPDGRRLCLLILHDEVVPPNSPGETNPTGLDALAEAMSFKISGLLRCFEKEWLQAR